MPSLEELLAISAKDTVESAVDNLFLNSVLRIIVIKNGSLGCRVITREKDFSVPVCKVKTVDVTGAGDSFDAGFLSSYLSGKSLLDCAKTASAAAALNCASFGPMEGNISPETVAKMIRNNYK